MEIILVLSFFYQALSIDCSSLTTKSVTLSFCSDTTDWVVGNLYPSGSYAALSRNDPKRFSNLYGQKIWENSYPYDVNQNLTCYISKTIYVPGTPTLAVLNAFADDLFSAKVNNVDVNCASTTYNQTKSCPITPNIASGFNYLSFTVNNIAGVVDSSGQNNAYLRYCLTITTSVKTSEDY